MTDIDEALDWRGNEVRCEACVHRELLADGRCRLKHACLHDRYARRIDRFFDWNPGLANDYLAHPHFEVRAIAAKSADVFRLPRLLDDPDETVRWNAVQRLPQIYLRRLSADPHREVRIRVASGLDDADLVPMMEDPDYYVRLIVARRIAPDMLPLMMRDPEVEVRRVVVGRIGADWLMPMAADIDAAVRLGAAQRLSPHQLIWLQQDPDWRVRHEVASRIEIPLLAGMRDDPDPFVRDVARRRLGAPQAGEAGRAASAPNGTAEAAHMPEARMPCDSGLSRQAARDQGPVSGGR